MAHKQQANGPATPPAPPVAWRDSNPAFRTGLEDLARRTVVSVLVAVAILSIAFLLWRGASVLLLAFAGLLFAVFLSTLSRGLTDRTGLPYPASLGVVLLALCGLIVGLGWILANRLMAQAADLAIKLPQSMTALRAYLLQFPWGESLLEQVTRSAQAVGQVGEFSRLTGLISGVFGVAVAVIVVLFVGIFGAAEPRLYRDGLAHLVPHARRKRFDETMEALDFNLRWWLFGQFLLMVVVGVTTGIGLWLIGIPEALMVGLLTGVLELIPYLGPWIAVVPAALLSFLVSPWHLMMTLGLFLFLHLIEAYVLLPLVQRRAVLLPPAVGLVAQVLLGELFGLLGLFVAAPLTLSVIVLIKMLYVEDTLGDGAVEVPGEPEKNQAAAVQV